jgi:hypothetical protein
LGHETLDPFLEYSPGHQHPPVTLQALDPDVGTHAHDAPLEAATGVLLSQTNDIVQVNLHHHADGLSSTDDHYTTDRDLKTAPLPWPEFPL